MYMHAALSGNSSREFLQYVLAHTINASKVYYNKSNLQYVLLRIVVALYLD
jgi:hypothetical protein